ncbi:hypothetical protein ABBQ32_003669 [Trebouxia sp. C0010 RCD-2024]
MASDKTATQVANRLLAEDWSASAYVRELQNEQVAAQNILFILQDQELRKLEPLIKVRLLLAPLFLRKQERDSLKDSLQVLADKLCLDDDDWVKVTAHAVGRYEGHLDLAAVTRTSRAVEASLSKLETGLLTATPTAHRPSEELYLSKRNVELAGGQEGQWAHNHFSLRQGAEEAARHLTLPAPPVQRSPSPMPLVAFATAAAGSNPKDATERRAMQSGTSFVTGKPGSAAGPGGRPSSAGGANLFMSARPPSRPSSTGARAASAGGRKAPAGKTAKVLGQDEALNLRSKAAYDLSQRQGVSRPAPKRVEASNPQLPVPPAASSSPARDSASQALWSPDTPEYVPHFTCCYEDTPAEQEAGEMQSVPSQEPVSYTTATAEKALDSLGSGKAVAPKPTGYGSSSFAPLAGRRSAT